MISLIEHKISFIFTHRIASVRCNDTVREGLGVTFCHDILSYPTIYNLN